MDRALDAAAKKHEGQVVRTGHLPELDRRNRHYSFPNVFLLAVARRDMDKAMQRHRDIGFKSKELSE